MSRLSKFRADPRVNFTKKCRTEYVFVRKYTYTNTHTHAHTQTCKHVRKNVSLSLMYIYQYTGNISRVRHENADKDVAIVHEGGALKNYQHHSHLQHACTHTCTYERISLFYTYTGTGIHTQATTFSLVCICMNIYTSNNSRIRHENAARNIVMMHQGGAIEDTQHHTQLEHQHPHPLRHPMCKRHVLRHLVC